MNWHYIYLIGVFIYLAPCYSYRILAIFPLLGKSHFNVLGEIAKAIAENGHQVDVISAFPLKESFPNYTDLITIPKTDNVVTFDFDAVKKEDLWFKTMHQQFKGMCKVLEHPDISNLINNPPSDPPYDLILIHVMWGYECFSAIGHLWDVPVIGASTTFLHPFFDRYIGNPLNLAVSSRNYRFYKDHLTFWDRLYNFILTYKFIGTYHWWGRDDGAIIKKYYGDRVPHYTVLQKSLSFMMINSHHSLLGVKPKVPALIEIGGIHITDDNSTADPNLTSVMDRSTDGFVYVSFGSRLVVETFPKEVVHKLFRVYEKLAPIQVIMKFENLDVLEIPIPKNVHFFTWVSQKNVLQHRNIKAFVTHGGGLSFQETVYYGVPIICIPVYADQIIHCDIASYKKIGLKLDMISAKQEEYYNVFNKILNDQTYAKASRKLSSLYRDRLRNPREEVAYWTEYVIRHGKDTLRSPTVDLEWWQIELLDVLSFIAAVILLTTSLAIFAVKKLFRLILSRTQSNAHVKLCKKLN